jgi:Transcriptional regulators
MELLLPMIFLLLYVCKLKRAWDQYPGRYCVVGFNNDAIGKIVEPQLTTIDYPELIWERSLPAI